MQPYKMTEEEQQAYAFLEYVRERVNKDYKTLQEIEEEQESYDFGDSVFFDVSLESLLDGLYFNGFNTEQIKTLYENRYGSIIQLYWLEQDEMYCMLVGAR